MKTLFFGALLLVSQTTFANSQVSFYINSWLPFGGNVYYNCDSVEYATRDMLQKLGAEYINVNCTGGINSGIGTASDASVWASFVVPSTGTQQVILFQGWDQCHLMGEIFKNIKNEFQIINVSGLRTCTRSNDPYYFVVTLKN